MIEFYVHIDFVDQYEGKYFIRVTDPEDTTNELMSFPYESHDTGEKLRRTLNKLVSGKLNP